mmetsp:Transcript_2588/g.5814  ORF Transcript_2588/g.5814 Transcript_2588/m.5814 type:complete len:385 (-) Transcript_2588:186-1340(-)|eukprot:CAMPEP_0201128166 /NCGR_PEP_ID=MMETSP0850-20130426/32854_1 /ASSEMBLY_ACC=CAM_ASM_000622 /TAXON_ID=183588 /ORGANISM="Pseudo-nitzschia fraudulenta, Strain WWA7" /LENGTH=384 /DNA_ID=CAMNT_0047397255 /DNA_START=69 /DNA_END=1223 /DNA_ORIENTATION=+
MAQFDSSFSLLGESTSSPSNDSSSENLLVQSIVKQVMAEISSKSGSNFVPPASILTIESGSNTSAISRVTKPGTDPRSVTKKTVGSSPSVGKKKKKKKPKNVSETKSKKKKPKQKKITLIQQLLGELREFEGDRFEGDRASRPNITIPPEIHGKSMARSASAPSVGSEKFYDDVASRLQPLLKSICIQGEVPRPNVERAVASAIDEDFRAAFRPTEMRCLALVSHNEMKSTLKDFVVFHKHVLKKFRLTGTQSTMEMLSEVFADDPKVVFGPTCKSGPLGGDAELVALMTTGQLGGLLFFQDPMACHPHQCDIDCLVRQAQVHNTVIASTPATAMCLVHSFRMALTGQGRAELLPSFFFSLQAPSVEAYKAAQKSKVKSLSSAP